MEIQGVKYGTSGNAGSVTKKPADLGCHLRLRYEVEGSLTSVLLAPEIISGVDSVDRSGLIGGDEGTKRAALGRARDESKTYREN